MFIDQVHTHTYTLFNTQDKTDATSDGDTSCSSVRYTHKHSLFNTQDNTEATADGYQLVHQSGTHIHTLFNTQDNTDATADGDTSCSSVRYTHKHSLFNTQDNTEATADGYQLVHQSGTHLHTLSLILKIIQTPRQMEIHHVHQSGTHTNTLFLILKITQTPRQIEIHHVHQSGTHTNTLFNTQDNTDATADGDTSCSSVRYIHIHSL